MNGANKALKIRFQANTLKLMKCLVLCVRISFPE